MCTPLGLVLWRSVGLIVAWRAGEDVLKLSPVVRADNMLQVLPEMRHCPVMGCVCGDTPGLKHVIGHAGSAAARYACDTCHLPGVQDVTRFGGRTMLFLGYRRPVVDSRSPVTVSEGRRDADGKALLGRRAWRIDLDHTRTQHEVRGLIQAEVSLEASEGADRKELVKRWGVQRACVFACCNLSTDGW